ncbi:MAG: MOSC domain-containing protein [Solirubrobacterales bacterium]|nr:MOSC domain-containing protein [Solirubrobacterales bacterium]
MRVAELWRYPVKSLRGERLERAEIAQAGIPGDRALRVADERGTVTARRKQRMVGLEAALGADGEPLVAGRPWDSEAAADAIRAVAGDGATLLRADDGRAHDAAPILVVSDAALGHLGFDRRRFRPNIVLAGAEGLEERGWVRGRLRVGAALLFVTESCERCAITTIDPDTFAVDPDVLRRTRLELGGLMGVYCSVLVAGTVAVGDRAEVV